MTDRENVGSGASAVGGMHRPPTGGARPEEAHHDRALGTQVAEAAGEARDEARRLAGEARTEVAEGVRSAVHRRKTRAADGLGTIAGALRQSGRQLHDRQDGTGDLVAGAADRVQRLSDHLRDSEVEELVDDLERAARRQPALFLGGAFLVGMLGARFLKSSRRASGGPLGNEAGTGATMRVPSDARSRSGGRAARARGVHEERDVTRETALRQAGLVADQSAPASRGTSATGSAAPLAGTSPAHETASHGPGPTP